jgi:hypothetical protein
MRNPKNSVMETAILESGLFDREWYLKTYPDVAKAGVAPLAHFLQRGAVEGRSPGPGFDTVWYLNSYPDVRPDNPLFHYIKFGKAQGRRPKPGSEEPGRHSPHRDYRRKEGPRAAAADLKASDPIAAGILRVTAIGALNPQSKGEEVIVVAAKSDRGDIDLLRFAREPVQVMYDVHVGDDRPLAHAIKLTGGQSIDLPVGAVGSIFLLKHPWSGSTVVETQVLRREFDLYAKATGLLRVHAHDLVPIRTRADAVNDDSPSLAARKLFPEALWRRLETLVENRALVVDSSPFRNTLALYTPRWRGVTAATTNLFPFALPVPLTPQVHPDDLTEDMIDTVVDSVSRSPFTTIVFSGGDKAFFLIFQKLLKRRASSDLRLLWHSSYMQMGEQTDWKLLLPWLDAAAAGQLRRIGVVKPGMETFFASRGIDATFVQNIVPFDLVPAVPRQARNSVGLWHSGSSDYRKHFLPSLLAVAGIEGLQLRAAGLGEFGCRLMEELHIPVASFSPRPIAHTEVLANMRLTDLTLYITLSECMPMVPLESMANGVPSLVGPATELFTDDPYLAERLIVNDPSDPAAIRRAIVTALGDLERLRERSTAYLDRLKAKAAESLSAFLA